MGATSSIVSVFLVGLGASRVCLQAAGLMGPDSFSCIGAASRHHMSIKCSFVVTLFRRRSASLRREALPFSATNGQKLQRLVHKYGLSPTLSLSRLAAKVSGGLDAVQDDCGFC